MTNAYIIIIGRDCIICRQWVYSTYAINNQFFTFYSKELNQMVKLELSSSVLSDHKLGDLLRWLRAMVLGRFPASTYSD